MITDAWEAERYGWEVERVIRQVDDRTYTATRDAIDRILFNYVYGYTLSPVYRQCFGFDESVVAPLRHSVKQIARLDRI